MQQQQLDLDPTNTYPLFWVPRIFLRLPGGPWHEVGLPPNGVWSHATLAEAAHLAAPGLPVQALRPLDHAHTLFELVLRTIPVPQTG